MAKKDNSKVNMYKLVVDQVLQNGDKDTVSFTVENKKPSEKDYKIFTKKLNKFRNNIDDTQYFHIKSLILGKHDNKKLNTFEDTSKTVESFFNITMN